MSQQDPPEAPEQRTNWYARLTIVFLFLFATFWSLGPFFFWTLLSLALYFGFFAIYTSSAVKTFFDRITTQLKEGPPPVTNPYQSFRPRQAQSTGSPASLAMQKTVRFLVIGFLGLFVLFFIIGIFTSTDEGVESTDTETVSIPEVPEEDNGTTYWNEKGNAALQNDLYDSSLYYYDQALRIDEQDMYALYNKGLAYVLHQQYQRGNSLARRCIAYHPEYDPAWWLLGYSYDLTNNTDSALYFLERAYTNGYTNPDFLQLTAEVYIKKGRTTDALNAYQKVVEQDTSRAEVWQKMAELDPSQAENYLRKVRALGK